MRKHTTCPRSQIRNMYVCISLVTTAKFGCRLDATTCCCVPNLCSTALLPPGAPSLQGLGAAEGGFRPRQRQNPSRKNARLIIVESIHSRLSNKRPDMTANLV